jgi:hypothetical protein
MIIKSIKITLTEPYFIKAKADVHFEGFELKGFIITEDPSTDTVSVAAPSYKTPHGWFPLFKTDDPNEWKVIQNRILDEYHKSLSIRKFNKDNLN